MAETLGQQYAGRVQVMHPQGQLGLGAAYLQGFAWAIAHDADYVIQMDADFSHSPHYIPQFLELIKNYDRISQSKMSVRVKLEAALRVFEIRWRDRDAGVVARLAEVR